MSYRVIVFSRYDRLGASSRLRFFQYYNYIEDNGGVIDTSPLFDDDYLIELYSFGLRSKIKVFKSYFFRMIKILTIYKYDVIIIEKELFPYCPALIEHLFKLLKIRYIVDYDDATFQLYEESRNFLVKFFLKNKINKIMSCAHTVTVGNKHLLSKARIAGAKNTIVIPTVIDILRYEASYERQSTPTICWVGSPSTQKYVIELKDVLIKVCLENKAKLVLVGATTSISEFFPDINLEVIPWEESTEALIIKNSDIGIMPIANTNWELGKCGYKLIQYMATGKPVVASKIGANIDIVENNCCGLLVSTNDEWYLSLTQLINDHQLSYSLGLCGRQRVKSIYSIQSQYQNLLNVIENANNKNKLIG